MTQDVKENSPSFEKTQNLNNSFALGHSYPKGKEEILPLKLPNATKIEDLQY